VEPDVDTEELQKSDEEMFQLANTDGSGKMSLEQFLTYMGAEEGDQGFAIKFHQ
jgi:Ca2+-binding EF-hand superfamily protein